MMTIDDILTVLQAVKDGKELEIRVSGGAWQTYHLPINTESIMVNICNGIVFRVKSETVKKKGWMNVYADRDGGRVTSSWIYDSEDMAQKQNYVYSWQYIATVPIEWEEAV